MTNTDRNMIACMARISETLRQHSAQHSDAVRVQAARFDAVLAELRALVEQPRQMSLFEKVA